MHSLSYILAIIAVLGNAVTYGTDTFASVVWRSSLRHFDDRSLTRLVGYVHHYGDRRLPIPGAVGAAAAVLSLLAAVLAGRAGAGVATGIAVAAICGWLLIYVRIAKPINEQFSKAALAGSVLADAAALQAGWDRVINLRVGLQMAAIAALCTSLALP